ncbi:MAG: hypothetical protein RLZZ182_1345, partial [Pseudomonadota bacterium]
MQSWITWLRGFSIRARLIACMGLVVGIGLLVGGGMTVQLLVLKSSLDGFAEQEFMATQKVGQLAQVLGQMRANESAALINTGDSVTVEAEVKAWNAHHTELVAVLKELSDKAPNAAIAEQVKAMQTLLGAYDKGIRPTLDLMLSNAISSSAEAFQSTGEGRAQAAELDKAATRLRNDVEKLAQARREQTGATV